MKSDQASLTATIIAAATVMCEHDRDRPPPCGAANWCARFLKTTRRGRWLLASARSRVCRILWNGVEFLTLPGIVAHWMCRKIVIDHLVRQAANEGFNQLIVLGAGLDSLAFRMKSDRVFDKVISADHPATIITVRDALCNSPENMQEEALPTSEVELLKIDFMTDEVRNVLSESTVFDPRQATVVVVEGVLMYLPEHYVGKLIKSLAGLPVNQMRLIASWMYAEDGQPIGFRGQSGMVGRMLKQSNEKMLWGSTPDRLSPKLSEWEWNITQIIDFSHHNDENPSPSIGLASEQLLVAEKRSSKG